MSSSLPRPSLRRSDAQEKSRSDFRCGSGGLAFVNMAQRLNRLAALELLPGGFGSGTGIGLTVFGKVLPLLGNPPFVDGRELGVPVPGFFRNILRAFLSILNCALNCFGCGACP